ncbi:glycoside hydrolase family 2 TIM barrel-domain containing protein [Flavihumibacter sp. CACIAM 22H1]|uniref:glycoside hydrolase family 2 protein n=1 Tax=Flavihumibacter sp. CACIAM 22H1 TaxID=1812911 RepID=UPI0007A80161|nr:glycoside hydrolase family 2 TIM barrel-domain containing protein [Flavihumibacter sp. CACIAM 22H1]KYP16340.1 MAG: hypothetical protein A1D16_16875 [Flavihumibacter sp. CACIAM 22H1]
MKFFLVTYCLIVFSVLGIGQELSTKPYPERTFIPSFIHSAKQVSIDLNGTWMATVKERNAGWKNIQVPGEWTMQGFQVEEGETLIYQKALSIPEDWKGLPIKLRFDGVSSFAKIKINGQVVKEHEGGFVVFEADITAYLNFRQDTLEVEVQALTISDKLGCISQYAVHTVGGILRKVSLFTAAPVYLQQFNYQVSLLNNNKTAQLALSSSIMGDITGKNCQLRFRLRTKEGKVVADQTVRAESKQNQPGRLNAELVIRSPKLWNPEKPYLYKLELELILDGKKIAAYQQPVGLREVKIAGSRLLVNGSPVKLKGVNRHAVHPLSGRSVSAALDRKDAVLFKEANCNYIRTSHYPPTEEFLEAADELGLFVESEAALCWIQHHASPIWRWWKYDDQQFLPYMLQANIENVMAGRLHPSVILWSLGNESRWSPLWEKVNAAVKSLDLTRPTVFHDQCWGGFNNAGSKADIANYHYPGSNGPLTTDTDTISRPTLFGEYAHLATYNRRELVADPGVRSFYGPLLRRYVDSMYAHPGNLGGAIWSGIDDIFHLPDGRILGYGPWGPLDGWRRKKPEYWGMKKAYSPLRIEAPNWSTVSAGTLQLKLENRFDFTSLKNCRVELWLDEQQQLIQPDIAPGAKGLLTFAVNPTVKLIQVKLYDPSGFLAEWEQFHSPQQEFTTQHKLVPLSYRQTPASIQVKQGDVYYSISKSTGIITGAWKNGRQVWKEGPVFTVVPMDNYDGGKPNVAGETYQNDIYPAKIYNQYPLFADSLQLNETAEGITVSFYINFQQSAGHQSYQFTRDGKCITSYAINYNGKDSIPYQYGLLVKLAPDFKELSWKRVGEFSSYPEDDIARLSGKASAGAGLAADSEIPGKEPAGLWKDDRNQGGTNDFRATKSNIREVALEMPGLCAVKVIGRGQQASRTWHQDSSIHWLVADYWNTGSEPFYGSPFTEGRIRISRKQLKGSTVFIIE